MPDRPIILSAPMVRALLDGRKTQHRLPIKGGVPAEPSMEVRPGNVARHDRPYLDAYCGERKTPANPRGMSSTWCWWTRDDRKGRDFEVGFVPGDRLWVREGITRFDKGSCDQHIWYRAGRNFHGVEGEHAYKTAFPSLTGDEEWPFEEGPGGGAPYDLSPIHMARWASRLTLVATDVRVQRLQDISEEDAFAEGVDHFAESLDHPGSWEGLSDADRVGMTQVLYGSARRGFHHLWERLHGLDAWSANPWICAVSFETHRANIDRMQAAAAEREVADA